MTIDQALRRTAVRAHILNNLGEAFATWHEQQLEALPLSLTDYWRACAELDEAQIEELNTLLEVLPSASDFQRMTDLATSLTQGELARMRAEDRCWLAEVRCNLIDGIERAQEGDFNEAYTLVKRSFDRLEWLLNGRSRSDPRRSLVNADVLTVLLDAHRMVAGLVEEFAGLGRLVMR